MHYPPTIFYIEPVSLEALSYHDDYTFEVLSKKHIISDLRLFIEDNVLHFTKKFTASWKHDGELKNSTIESSMFSLGSVASLSSICNHLVQQILDENPNYPDALSSYFYNNIKTIVDKGISTSTNMSWPAVTVPDISKVAESLPGMDIKVSSPCPCTFAFNHTIYWTVQHLNDNHMWSREKIADWLDKLMDVDGIDLTFKVDTDEV